MQPIDHGFAAGGDMLSGINHRMMQGATRYPRDLAWRKRWHSGVYARYGKRAFDVVMSLLIILISLPILLTGLLLAALDGNAPLFGHLRMGRHGRPFRCLKLRTMVQDAENQLACILGRDPQAAREWAMHQKLSNDPRVTPVGRFLRSSFLDELPQLVNVLRGEMSLVGPRPVTAQELSRYRGSRYLVLSVRPGMTGAWQVTGHGCTSFEDRVRMDVDYVQSLSFVNDLKILFRTVLIVLRRRGR